MAIVDPVVVTARLVLLDALEALGTQRRALILVGAQAVYLWTGPATLAIAEYTRDADLAIDTDRVADTPQIDEALLGAGFTRGDQPGTWTSTRRTSAEEPVPVDFLVAEAMAGRPGRRAAVVPGQPDNSARQVRGLEGVLVDNNLMRLTAFNDDPRSFELRVAGPAALLVAKVHKIAERVGTKRGRDKDALDVYRLLRAVELQELGQRFRVLGEVSISAEPTRAALRAFESLFGSASGVGTEMIVRALSGLEEEDEVRRSAVALAEELISTVR